MYLLYWIWYYYVVLIILDLVQYIIYILLLYIAIFFRISLIPQRSVPKYGSIARTCSTARVILSLA
jgi:hypothetical protein